MSPTFVDVIAPARLAAIARRPYYATALLALDTIPVSDGPPVAVDQRGRILVNPAAAATASIDELAARLVHGLEHLLRGHAARGEHLPSVEPARWRIAACCEISDDTADCDQLPDVPCPCRLGLPDGLLAEEYADLLLTDDASGGAGDGPGDCGDLDNDQQQQPPGGADEPADPTGGGCAGGTGGPQRVDGPAGLSGPRLEVLRRETADAVQRHRGDVPLGLRRWATATAARPAIPWTSLLMQLLRATVRGAAGASDYDRSRPNRRSPHPFVLPRLATYTPRPAVVIDTSASMTDADLAEALDSIDQVLAHIRPTGLRLPVIVCDAEVHEIQHVTATSQIRLHGDGGTDLMPGIAAAARQRADVAIVLTDGWATWPEQAPPGPVILALIGDHTAPASDLPPWARTVRIARSPR